MTSTHGTGLPSGWVLTDLQTIAEVNPKLDKSAFSDSLEVTFVPMPALEAMTGVVDVSQTRRLGEVKKGYTPFRKGDVLFAKITPCMENGKMAVVPDLTNGLGFGSTEFHVLRRYLGVSAEYICYFVSSQEFRRDAEHNMTGAVGQRRVPAPYLSRCDIPVPPALEQERIVAKIDELFSELDKAVESLETAREQLKVYRQAVLKEAFEGRLTAQWREDHDGERAVKPVEVMIPSAGEPVSPEEAAVLPILPEEWAWVHLGSICSVTGGLTKNQKKRQSLTRRMKYLRVANVYADRLELDDVREISVTDDEVSKVALENGDLLIVEGNGSVGQIGRVAMWTCEIPECGHQNHLIRARVTADCLPRYLLQFLLSPVGRDVIMKKASSTTGLHTLSISKVSQLPVPLTSASEQRAILTVIDEKLSAIDAVECEIDTQLLRAESLRQSIFRSAFSGRLVRQDPNDEPATVLLERIRTEKEQAEKDRKTKKSKKKRTAA